MNIISGFPTVEEIKKEYTELLRIIENVRTIEQARAVERKYKIPVEINGMSIDDFVNGLRLWNGTRSGNRGTNTDIEWIRYEVYGNLSYIYDRFDGKPRFDVFSDYCDCEFIENITIDELTEELYTAAIMNSV